MSQKRRFVPPISNVANGGHLLYTTPKGRRLYSGNEVYEKFGESGLSFGNCISDNNKVSKQTEVRKNIRIASKRCDSTSKIDIFAKGYHKQNEEFLKFITKNDSQQQIKKGFEDPNSTVQNTLILSTNETNNRTRTQNAKTYDKAGTVFRTIQQHILKKSTKDKEMEKYNNIRPASTFCRKKAQLEVLATIYKMQNELKILRERRVRLAETINRKTTTAKKTKQEE